MLVKSIGRRKSLVCWCILDVHCHYWHFLSILRCWCFVSGYCSKNVLYVSASASSLSSLSVGACSMSAVIAGVFSAYAAIPGVVVSGFGLGGRCRFRLMNGGSPAVLGGCRVGTGSWALCGTRFDAVGACKEGDGLHHADKVRMI